MIRAKTASVVVDNGWPRTSGDDPTDTIVIGWAPGLAPHERG